MEVTRNFVPWGLGSDMAMKSHCDVSELISVFSSNLSDRSSEFPHHAPNYGHREIPCYLCSFPVMVNCAELQVSENSAFETYDRMAHAPPKLFLAREEVGQRPRHVTASHVQEKPRTKTFPCEICGRHFKWQSTLQVQSQPRLLLHTLELSRHPRAHAALRLKPRHATDL